MSENPAVTAIIVNYNGARLLPDCLEALTGQTYPCASTIVVDNGSSDGSVRLLRERFPEVRVVECGRNLGYAEGNNRGVAVASTEFVLLLNNDARLHPEAVSHLVWAASDPSLVAVQSKVLREGERGTIDSVGSSLTPTGFLHHVADGESDRDMPPRDVFSARAVCLLVRRDEYERLGRFDPDYFAYFEETDFCWRAWLAGMRVRVEPKAVAYHLGSATSRTLRPAFLQFHEFKNRIATIVKNGSPGTVLFMMPIHLFLCGALAARFLARSQPSIAAAIVRAMAWNARNLRATLRKRRVVQRELRRIRDRALFAECLVWKGTGYYLERFREATGKFARASRTAT